MNIKEALQAKRPEVAEMAAHLVRYQYDQLVRKLGKSMQEVANSVCYRVWDETVRPVCKRVPTGEKVHGRDVFEWELNEEALARFADKQAGLVIEAWQAKIQEKLGELEDGQVQDVTNHQYRITGKRDGAEVRIEQSMIINVSGKGKLFNQFPARIYVDGKFMSAAKYKARFS